MKRYVQFYTMGLEFDKKSNRVIGKKPVWLLGNDGVFDLDGRYSIDTCVSEAHRVAALWNKCVRAGIVGYEIRQGSSYSNSRVIKKYKNI